MDVLQRCGRGCTRVWCGYYQLLYCEYFKSNLFIMYSLKQQQQQQQKGLIPSYSCTFILFLLFVSLIELFTFCALVVFCLIFVFAVLVCDGWNYEPLEFFLFTAFLPEQFHELNYLIRCCNLYKIGSNGFSEIENDTWVEKQN